MADSKCGTPTGYQRHYRLDEPYCTPCRQAWRKYIAARNRALSQLAKRHAREFRKLLAAERKTGKAEIEHGKGVPA